MSKIKANQWLDASAIMVIVSFFCLIAFPIMLLVSPMIAGILFVAGTFLFTAAVGIAGKSSPFA